MLINDKKFKEAGNIFHIIYIYENSIGNEGVKNLVKREWPKLKKFKLYHMFVIFGYQE